jgi:hypothetical protein
MNRRTIPDDEQLAGYLLLQLLQKPDDAYAVEGLLLHPQKEFDLSGAWWTPG